MRILSGKLGVGAITDFSGFPLTYYSAHTHTFLSPSALMECISSGECLSEKEVNPDVLKEYFNRGRPGKLWDTMIPGVYRVPPHSLAYLNEQTKRLVVKPWFKGRQVSNWAIRHLITQENKVAYLDALRSKVTGELFDLVGSGEHIACFCSGGIDSLFLLAVLLTIQDSKPKVYVVDYEDVERPLTDHMLKLVDEMGLPHRHLEYDTDALDEITEKTVGLLYRPPVCFGSVILLHAISRVRERHIIFGHGGDELFGPLDSEVKEIFRILLGRPSPYVRMFLSQLPFYIEELKFVGDLNGKHVTFPYISLPIHMLSYPLVYSRITKSTLGKCLSRAFPFLGNIVSKTLSLGKRGLHVDDYLRHEWNTDYIHLRRRLYEVWRDAHGM